MTAKLSLPVTASWESLGPGTTTILSSITLPEEQGAEDKEEGAKVKEPGGNNEETDKGKDEKGREERSAAQTGKY